MTCYSISSLIRFKSLIPTTTRWKSENFIGKHMKKFHFISFQKSFPPHESLRLSIDVPNCSWSEQSRLWEKEKEKQPITKKWWEKKAQMSFILPRTCSIVLLASYSVCHFSSCFSSFSFDGSLGAILFFVVPQVLPCV